MSNFILRRIFVAKITFSIKGIFLTSKKFLKYFHFFANVFDILISLQTDLQRLANKKT